jgi:catechol 2,3-dioxygenase-like lactoylglutathione lyase family enzyme
MFCINVTLYTRQVDRQLVFYRDVLNMDILESSDEYFTVKAGRTMVRFQYSQDATPYHFAFNIPSNLENEALSWLNDRVEILPYDGKQMVDFTNWNAKAMYFHDPDCNIVEFIARKNLAHNIEADVFQPGFIFEISEIGAPVNQIKPQFDQLNRIRMEIYDGSFDRFCAVGTEHALFIVIDKNKKKWFPVDQEAHSSPFEAVLTHDYIDYQVTFSNGNIEAKQV